MKPQSRPSHCRLSSDGPKKKKKNLDQASELPVVVFVLTRPCRGLESFICVFSSLVFVKQNMKEEVEVTVYQSHHFRGQSSRRALFGHTGCWSIAKCSQISCRNYTGGFRSWPPATSKFSTRRSFDHLGKGSGNFSKKRASKKEKKVESLIDLKVMKTRNDCEIACDCVKRANVVLHIGLCKEIFARKHTATHKLTSAQLLTVTTMTYI